MNHQINHQDQVLQVSSWPQAILHLDADSFFASVEQSVKPQFKGKPISVGGERGIVTAASYEAKKFGIKTGMSLVEARRLCPKLISLPSDYETYSLFSKRIFAIMRRFTPMVEEYSIDEAFADISGLRRVYRKSYEDIGRDIKQAIESELGITVSVGISLSKSLAKLCSKYKKPSGLVSLSGKDIHRLLQVTDTSQVWGFGKNTVSLLEKYGIRSALDYVLYPESFVKNILGKIGLEIHRELRGQLVYPITSEEKSSYVTMSKVKTFSPPSADRDFIYAQALKNLENVCSKARRYQLRAGKLYVLLRRRDFKNDAMEMRLSRSTYSTLDLVKPFTRLFNKIYHSGIYYRSTGVALGDLSAVNETQFNFFEDPHLVMKREDLSLSIDELNKKYGKNKIHLAESLFAHKDDNGHKTFMRAQEILKGENQKQRLSIPLFRQEGRRKIL